MREEMKMQWTLDLMPSHRRITDVGKKDDMAADAMGGVELNKRQQDE